MNGMVIIQNGCWPIRFTATVSTWHIVKKEVSGCRGPVLGRPKKDAVRDRRLEYKDNCDRVEVERAFSLAKRRFGLSQIRTYLKETTQSVIALSILALNLGKLQAIQCTPILFYIHLLLWKVKRALKWAAVSKSGFCAVDII